VATSFSRWAKTSVRDKDLFDLQNVRKEQRDSISLWTTTTKGACDRSVDRLGIDAEKVADETTFGIGKIHSCAEDRSKGNLDLPHGSSSRFYCNE